MGSVRCANPLCSLETLSCSKSIEKILMLHVTDLSVYRASFVLSAAVSISYVFFVLCADSELLFTVVLCKSQVIAVPAQSSSSSHITDFTASRVFLKKKKLLRRPSPPPRLCPTPAQRTAPPFPSPSPLSPTTELRGRSSKFGRTGTARLPRPASWYVGASATAELVPLPPTTWYGYRSRSFRPPHELNPCVSWRRT
jgi:hypothetical protein